MKQLILALFINFCAHSTLFAQELISLITPHDRDTIETFYPVLSWNYVNIGQYRDQERYVLTLVEIQEDQSANAAVQVNHPIIRIDGIQGFQFMYPFDAPALKINQRYGWRIQRSLNGVIVNESEAWEFIIYKEVKVPNKYVKLSLSNQNAVHVVKEEGFYFEVQSKYGNANLRIHVENEKGATVTHRMGTDEKQLNEYELTATAENYYYLKTRDLSPGIYKVIAKDGKGNQYSSKFKVN